MASHPFVSPPHWTDEQLDRDRRIAIAAFVEERAKEGGQRYRDIFARDLAMVQQLFDVTNNLRTLSGGAALAVNPSLLEVARYLGGPPVSADDLDTIASTTLSKRKRLDADQAALAATVVMAWLDVERVPWLFAHPPRNPTVGERDIAIRWTAGLMAAQKIQTRRRNESAQRQQAAVRDYLRSIGFRMVEGHRVTLVSHLEPETFFRNETVVAGKKCDVPACLRDGRLLLIECKVSNSGINSVKRLNREVGDATSAWRQAFGNGAITGAILSGVFKLASLKSAQNAGTTIFWEHDLNSFGRFIQSV